MPEIVELKKCKNCEEEKDISMFRKNRRKCKKCEDITHNRRPNYYKLYYEKNKEYYKEFYKQHYQKKKEQKEQTKPE
jgi:hypothetical protein